MKFLKALLIIIAVIIVIVLVLSLISPTTIHVERSASITAPKSLVYDNVSRFENINKWTPWADYDSNMKMTITGTDGTVGATSSWVGNDKVGQGSQTIQQLVPDDRVDMDIHFIKPYDSHAQAYYQLSDSNGATKVIWAINSSMPRPWNAMGLFMNMDKMIGQDFERGLDKLKKLSEDEAIHQPKMDSTAMQPMKTDPSK
jgi:hypothetical protein